MSSEARGDQTRDHIYDPAGNRTGMYLWAPSSSTYFVFTYDPGNQLQKEEKWDTAYHVTSYTYDEAGNRIEKESPAETTVYEWDDVGRMATAEPPAGITSLTYCERSLKNDPLAITRN